MLNRLKPKSEFSRNVVTLMTGTTISQAIPIAISPILTRIYTPEDFGVLAIFVAITSIISIFATGKYELAIMLPKKEEDAINIVALSIVISFFVSFIVLLFVFFFNEQIVKLLGNAEISNWLYFAPLSVLLSGIYQSFNFWSNRKKQYKRLAVSRVVQSSVNATSNLSIVFLGFITSGLIVSQIIGQTVATGVLSKLIWNEDKKKFSKIKKLKIIEFAKQYIDHPKFLIYSYGVSSVYAQIPIFFIGRVFDLTVLGFFSLANKFINLPGGLIANALGDVFRQRATEEYHNTGKFDRLLIKTVKHTFLISIVPFSLFLFLAPNIFEFVFGGTWRIAGEYAQILTISAYFSFVITPIDKAALITNQMSYIYKWHTAKLIFYSTWILISYYAGISAKEFIFGLVAVDVLFYLIELFYEYKFSKGITSE